MALHPGVPYPLQPGQCYCALLRCGLHLRQAKPHLLHQQHPNLLPARLQLAQPPRR